tara:strand:+ start:68 stop:472 length:405 start_codon:yes stop_codon:yes gene_type:complete
MKNLKKNEEEVLRKSKNFGYTFSIIFLLTFLYSFFFSKISSYYFLALSLLILFLTVIKPNLFSLFSNIWEKFGLLLGRVFSPLILALIYLITIIPINLIVRILRIDLINKKLSNKVKSYWIIRKDSKVNFKDQF